MGSMPRIYTMTIEFEVAASARYTADEDRWAREVAQVAARAVRRGRHVDKSTLVVVTLTAPRDNLRPPDEPSLWGGSF